jgi:hypothetical protein
MTRLDWDQSGQRYYETGVDRGVLFVEGDPGVPWTGLVSFTSTHNGGTSTPRYLDGVKISNRSSPEEFEGTIEAYTYPVEFERCDGTYMAQSGLRVNQQRRKPFNMVYRSKIGNEIEGLERAYKIHLLYNLTAEPTDRAYQTLKDQNDPLTFSWKVTSRGEVVEGFRPTAHFTVDTRDIPSALLSSLEDLLYGTDTTSPSIPTPGELLFMFDSYLDTVYDAGSPYTPVFATYDAGTTATAVVSTIDGGGAL